MNRRIAILAAALIATGCASVPDAPPPVVIEPGPGFPPGPNAQHCCALTPMLRPSPTPAVPGATYPLLPLGVTVTPHRPRQASVVAVRIVVPPGPALEAPTATFAGREVSLARTDTGWIGVAGLPVDSSGVFALEVRGERGGVEELERRLIISEPRVYPSSRIRISAGAASDPEVDARIERESRLIRSRLASSADEWIPDGPFDWPRPPVRTSPFGERRMFNGSVRSRHMGLDLRGRRGQGTYAPAAGRVLLTGRFYYQGNAVYVDHGLGLVTAYFHFDSFAVEEGDLVAPGQLLGRVGSTGRSTAPHLHWSAYVHGQSVDPESLIGFRMNSTRPIVQEADDRGGR